MPDAERSAEFAPLTECGFCDGGIWISSRRLAEGLPPEVPCPYCDGAGQRTERGEPDA